MNILFVENHQIFAKFVTGQFLNQHQVTIVPKISDAWAILSKEQTEIDIVLVDFDLDDGKGDKLIENIKTHHLNVKMVAVSSHNSGNLALQTAGADAICGKFEFSRIGAVIEQLSQTNEYSESQKSTNQSTNQYNESQKSTKKTQYDT